MRRAAIAAAVATSFTRFSVAAEPLVLKPSEKTELTIQRPENESTELALTLICMLAVSGAGAYAVTRKRRTFRDDD